MSKSKRFYYIILGCLFSLISFPFKIFKSINTKSVILLELKNINYNLKSLNELLLSERIYNNYMFNIRDNKNIYKILMDRDMQKMKEKWPYN